MKNVIPFFIFVIILAAGILLIHYFKETQEQKSARISFEALHNNVSAVCWQYHPIYKKDIQKMVYYKNGSIFSISKKFNVSHYSWSKITTISTIFYYYEKGAPHGYYYDRTKMSDPALEKRRKEMQDKDRWTSYIKEQNLHCKEIESLEASLFEPPKEIDFIEKLELYE